jgi:hypothetical protein
MVDAMSRQPFLLVIGNREALQWIITEQRLAFPAGRGSRFLSEVQQGTELVLYTTRGCFRNPTRDRGRVIGIAEVTSAVGALRETVQFGDRSFPVGCSVSLPEIAQFGEGVELAGLVDRLPSFPRQWAIHIRKTLVPIGEKDLEILRTAVASEVVPRGSALPTYETACHPTRRRADHA